MHTLRKGKADRSVLALVRVQAIPTHGVSGISEIEGVVMEIVITFALV